jgi:hypothetical protein
MSKAYPSHALHRFRALAMPVEQPRHDQQSTFMNLCGSPSTDPHEATIASLCPSYSSITAPFSAPTLKNHDFHLATNIVAPVRISPSLRPVQAHHAIVPITTLVHPRRPINNPKAFDSIPPSIKTPRPPQVSFRYHPMT